MVLQNVPHEGRGLRLSHKLHHPHLLFCFIIMRVIPSALLLSIGSVAAQDDVSPLTSTSGADAGGDPIHASTPELFGGDLGGVLSGIFGGDSSGGFGDLSDLISGMFAGGDAADADGQGNILEVLLGAEMNGPINLECPSTCGKPDLCKIDPMSLMMGSTNTLQEMCDTGCIPTIVLDACASATDAVSAATAAGGGGTAAFIASTGVCDFVNCCIKEETGNAATATGTKFDECEAELQGMALPHDSATGTSDFGDLAGMFDMGNIQDMIEEIVDGFEEVGDMLSDMFQSMFDSSSIPAFCAVDTCTNAPDGFCECFSGDLAQCNTTVISQACTSDSFSTCAPEGFTEFCSSECGQSSGSDVLHMCAMCNVVTCCSKDNAEIEGCLSEALAVDHSQVDMDALSEQLEDLLGGMGLEGILTEVLGNMESMKWCPNDKTCPDPLGQQFCDIANGGPSAIDLDTAVSSTRDIDLLQSFDLASMGMDLDKMCSDDMLLSCGPVNMKAKCDSECGSGDNEGIMKEAFCRLCGLATCCEGKDKTFSECSSVTYIPAASSATPTSGESNQEDSTSEPPTEESEVTNETISASDGALAADFTAAGPEESAEPEAAELQPAQIVALENSRLEQENSGIAFSSVSSFTAIISTGLVLVLY